jgi:glycosyltransferase involved in cell wall biosynthesis
MKPNPPTISDLPAPPPGKTGWPWTEGLPPLGVSPANGHEWPRISIVTPCYNHEQFIEETIRSVLLQQYPNLEFFVMDGGSKDKSPEIIRKYAPFLTGWVSERDRGQSHAINKGLAQVTGDIIAYINSDDYYLPGAFKKVAEFCLNNPKADLIHGRCRYINVSGAKIGEQMANIYRYEDILDLWDVWWAKRQFVQPEVFWTKRIANKVGNFREELDHVFDYDYWVRILKAGGTVGTVQDEVTCFRFVEGQKSSRGDEPVVEQLEVVKPYIWEDNDQVPPRRRKELKGKWLYDSLFRKEADQSLTVGQSRFQRWMRLSAIALKNPPLLSSTLFRNRVKKAILGK